MRQTPNKRAETDTLDNPDQPEPTSDIHRPESPNRIINRTSAPTRSSTISENIHYRRFRFH